MDEVETTESPNLDPEQLEEIDDIIGDYDGPIELVDWHGHKLAILNAARINTEFLNKIENRRKENRSVIIVVVGEPGEGKSWLAMRFAQIFDKDFDVLDPDESPEPGKDPSQVVFERSNFFFLIGKDTPLKYGQVIMPDEAQYAAGSRRWYEELQIDLMEQVESVRSMGFIIVIVALHLDLLDKIIRKFVLTYMFRVSERGKAIVYRLYTPTFGDKMHQKRLGIMYLQMPDIEYCSSNRCLRCEYLNTEKDERCITLRAKYERKKRDFLDRRNVEAQKKEEIKKARKYTVQEDADHAEDYKDLYRWNEQGRLMPECIRLILEADRDNYQPSERRIKAVRDRLEIQHPELRKERGWNKEKS